MNLQQYNQHIQYCHIPSNVFMISGRMLKYWCSHKILMELKNSYRLVISVFIAISHIFENMIIRPTTDVHKS